MPGRVKAVLADLDDTLFDHRHATRTALGRLAEAQPAFAVWPAEELARRHAEILEVLHLEVLSGRRTIAEARTERFARLLAAAGSNGDPARVRQAADVYRVAYETAWRPVAGTHGLLAALAERRLPVAIVTNNKTEEQRRKLKRIGLDGQVAALVTSEEVGLSKPDRRIFDAALERVGVRADEAVMLGDGWATDVNGARGAGIAVVWLNRFGLASPDASVPELTSLEPADVALERLGIELREGRASARPPGS